MLQRLQRQKKQRKSIQCFGRGETTSIDPVSLLRRRGIIFETDQIKLHGTKLFGSLMRLQNSRFVFGQLSLTNYQQEIELRNGTSVDCVFCNNMLETRDHLFFLLEYAERSMRSMEKYEVYRGEKSQEQEVKILLRLDWLQCREQPFYIGRHQGSLYNKQNKMKET